MDYRKYGDTVYIRMDKGDEIISGILDICKREGIASAVFTGIGGGITKGMRAVKPTFSREIETVRG